MRDIIVLSEENNRKGDLFNQMVYDVFHALGFGDAHYNIQKAGREIDIIMHHRTENRVAIIECKAEKSKVSGADINKFMGAFNIECNQYTANGGSAVGYFVARAGFTETALAQEKERKAARAQKNDKSELILLGPTEIAQELIQGKVLCSPEVAATAVVLSDGQLRLCEEMDLLVSENGWIWVLYYAHNPRQGASHFALVHADGNPLRSTIANAILSKASRLNLSFSSLTYIDTNPANTLDKDSAQKAYFNYLKEELGEIQFEGMPTDKEAGSVKVNLENIFVPLRFIPADRQPEIDDTDGPIDIEDIEHRKSVPIGEVLHANTKVAILAKPGGGKSTLIRRVALAYAFPDRLKKVDDGLPEEHLFPIYIRCRDLGNDITKSISEIIKAIVHRAEISKLQSGFEALVEDALQSGQVLLLIDGLDEISNEKHRICFVNQLRTFVATYPTVHMLVTSRVAGFRAVAGTLTSYCKQYSIANLNESQMRLLSLKWHQAILGESVHVADEANKVCDIILKDPRIVALAENPLLLTTLLFVKRWVGYLPTKKRQLYEEMIKLLLVTWNAAGHEKLDMDETEPQLAFVAYAMTVNGQQRITRDRLEESIIEARKALPELLSYTSISPSVFIDQVEERSSLLIQSGLEENENGKLVPAYEFSHLSFQEYLTARAIEKEWTADSERSSPLDILISHLGDDHWKEVIPLAAALLGRVAKPLVEQLAELSEQIDPCATEDNYSSSDLACIASLHLANCIASEVPMSQTFLESAITLIVQRRKIVQNLARHTNYSRSLDVFDSILKSKYGEIYQEVICRTLFDSLDIAYIYEFSEAWFRAYVSENSNIDLESIVGLLNSKSRQNRVTGALLQMDWSFSRRASKSQLKTKTALQIYSAIHKMLLSDDDLSLYASAWCIAWSGYSEADIIPSSLIHPIANTLASLWVSAHAEGNIRRVISWALSSVCTPDLQLDNIAQLPSAIEMYYEAPENDFDRLAAIHVSLVTKYWNLKYAKQIIDGLAPFVGVNVHVDGSRFLMDQGLIDNKIKTKEALTI